MIDVKGKNVSVAQAIAHMKRHPVGLYLHRQAADPPIDVLRRRLIDEATREHCPVLANHVDEDLLLIIPLRRGPTSAREVRAAMNDPAGI